MGIKTSQKILKYISEKGQTSGKELADFLNDIGERAVRKQLKNLLDSGQLLKIGKPPKVFYFIPNSKDPLDKSTIVDTKTKKVINERYLYITPSGDELSGWTGFVAWCLRTKQEPVKTAHEYISTLKKYDIYLSKGLINGMKKMRQTFDTVYLDELYYIDFYSIERFGKTKLGQMLLYAKQSQNRQLMKKLIDELRPKVISLIVDKKIDGIMFIPPTVIRSVQFMKELEKQMNITTKSLRITKIKTPISVPQKTLNKLEDRVLNAQKTFAIEDSGMYKNILLIDDAVGSGSTLNEVAQKIRNKGMCTGKIIGLAITGSFKGFDVISEV